MFYRAENLYRKIINLCYLKQDEGSQERDIVLCYDIMRSDISYGNISISDNTLHFDHSKILHNVKMRATSNFLLMFDDNNGPEPEAKIKFISRINYKTINVKIFDPEIRKKLLQNDEIDLLGWESIYYLNEIIYDSYISNLTTDNMHLDSIYTLYENQTSSDTNEYFIVKYLQIDINTLKYVLIKNW